MSDRFCSTCILLLQILVLILVMLFGSSIPIYAQQVITSPTGDPTVVGVGRVMFPVSEADYRAAAETRRNEDRFIPISGKPEGLSDSVRFGFDLVFGGWNRSWILDNGPDGILVFYGDFNANGDLSDEEPVRLERTGSSYTGEYRSMQVDTLAGVTTSYPLNIKIEVAEFGRPGTSERTQLVAYRTRQLRKGTFDIRGKRIPFGLVGSEGRFDGVHDAVYIDLNADGELDMKAENDAAAPASTERFPPGGSVTLDGTAYSLIVDRYGRTLTLHPLVNSPDMGTAPGVGQLVPDIPLKSLDGRTFRLSDLLGRVVLLDFWGIWCAPCIEGIPQITEAYERLSHAGFEIISVNVGDDQEAVRRFVKDHGMKWVHVLEEDGGLLQQFFQIRAFPTFIVIGRDGTLLSSGLGAHEPLIDQLVPLVKN